MAIVGKGGALSARASIEGGADLVQVRAKELVGRDLMVLVRDVVAELGGGDRVIVNSRPDVAERAGAWGVHLPESGLDVREVRSTFPRLRIGVSRHSRDGLLRAADEGADYALLGPMFSTPLKEDRVLRTSEWTQWLGLVGALPVIAVGGITPENALRPIVGGCRGVAAIRLFQEPGRATEEARRLRGVLSAALRSAELG